jgi:hypothetical protein
MGRYNAMNTLNAHLSVRKITLAAVLVVGLAVVGTHVRSYAAAGACSAPATDYGTVTSTVNITGAGTYRIWTRLAAPDSTNNTYKLEIDGNQCYTIGGSTVPVFTTTQDTNGNRFASASTNWFSKDTTSANIDVNLTAANHTFKLIGTAPGVVVDRLVLTQDTSCTPTGTGDNCANPPDTTAPIVSITSPANNATLSTTTTVTASATDDVAVSKVEFYVDGVLKATDTSASYTYSLNPTTFTNGSHALTAKAYDTSNNVATSATVTVTTSGGSAILAADVNQDGAVNFLDLSALASNYGKSGGAITIARTDINGDGTVNFLDLSALASKYGS